MMFIPNDDALEAKCHAVFEQVATAENFKVRARPGCLPSLAGLSWRMPACLYCIIPAGAVQMADADGVVSRNG